MYIRFRVKHKMQQGTHAIKDNLHNLFTFLNNHDYDLRTGNH